MRRLTPPTSALLEAIATFGDALSLAIENTNALAGANRDLRFEPQAQKYRKFSQRQKRQRARQVSNPRSRSIKAKCSRAR